MRIHQILTLAVLAGMALPAGAQVPWDMAPTEQVAPELQQAKYQSPANPASTMGGYSIAAPQNAGTYWAPAYSASGGQSAEQGALNSGGAVGDLGRRAVNGYGYNPTQTWNRTHSQNLGLPSAGTMGLAPVFGTGNDGFTSPGGYVPPMINIPGVGSYRIPQTIGLPGGLGSVTLPVAQP